MDSHAIVVLLLLVSFTLSFFPLRISSYGPTHLSAWCKQTPHPKQCEYYLSHNENRYHDFPIKGKSDFLNIIMKNAMENAMRLHQSVYSLGSNCEDEKEKAAWTDCLELYELAIQHLNQTLSTNMCTQVDAQTWLSSALTHFQTCQEGYSGLGLAKPIMHLILSNSNVSCLISNALAINQYGSRNNSGPTGPRVEFPSWVRPGDRKLLRSSLSLAASRANLVVAQDGSAEFRTVWEAIEAVSRRKERYVIYIKAGTYKENVEIAGGLTNIMLLGDAIGRTIISGSRSVGGAVVGDGFMAVVGDGFMAQGVTFRNTAGPSNHQAVALRSSSDFSVFYKCSFKGYQDTLYVHSNQQFYRDCNIYGTVDFIFGNAAVVIQNCNIYARFPPGRTNTITGQVRTDPNQNTGISIHNCHVTSATNLGGAKTYLGRPWQKYSRTVFMKTYLDNIIEPRGWLEWSGNFALNTLYYGEYANIGPGSSTANRVKWPGYHVITSANDAGRYAVGGFLAGNSWLPNTGVPFAAGL